MMNDASTANSGRVACPLTLVKVLNHAATVTPHRTQFTILFVTNTHNVSKYVNYDSKNIHKVKTAGRSRSLGGAIRLKEISLLFIDC